MTSAARWRDLGAAVVVLATGIVFLLWAYTYPPSAAAMPKLVGWLTIVLALIDAASQFDTPPGRMIRRLVSSQTVIEWKPQGEKEAVWRRVALSVLWVAGYVGAVLLAGFLIATPLYVGLYMTLHGHKSIRAGAWAAVLTTAAIWFTFEVLFRYPLYPGLLFGGR